MIDLSSLRFIDVAGAIELVHAAEKFPTRTGWCSSAPGPGVHRVLDRCGAPFAAAARGRAPRGGPVRITSPPEATRLSHCARSTAPTSSWSPSSCRSSRPPRDRASRWRWAAAHHRAGVSRASPRATWPSRRAGPPGRRGRAPGQTLAARWARELRTLTAGATGPSASSPSTGPLRRLRRQLLDRARRRDQRRAERPPRHHDLLLPRPAPARAVLDGARSNHRTVLAEGGPPTTPTTWPRRRYWPTSPPRRADGARAARRAACTSARGSCTRCGRRSSRRCWRPAASSTAPTTSCWRSTRWPRTRSSTGRARRSCTCGPTTNGFCEVHDRGSLADPLPGLQAPHPSHPKGRGLWIARQLCDMLHIWSDADGTHVLRACGPQGE